VLAASEACNNAVEARLTATGRPDQAACGHGDGVLRFVVEDDGRWREAEQNEERLRVDAEEAVHGRAPRSSALRNVAFLGTSVESGAATAVVVATGKNTYLGSMAESLQAPQAPTAFDRGITQFTWLMLRFMLVMVPLVFVINGLTKGNWIQAFFFALAVAVGLTPEMLPMIVTVCLSKARWRWAKESHRQANQCYPELGCDGRAVYRPRPDIDDGPGRSRALL